MIIGVIPDDIINVFVNSNVLYLLINKEEIFCKSLILFIYDNIIDKHNIDHINKINKFNICIDAKLSESIILRISKILKFMNFKYKNNTIENYIIFEDDIGLDIYDPL